MPNMPGWHGVVLGCGMVHPNVLRNGGLADPDLLTHRVRRYGLGPERIAMLKYGIDYIRLFWANNFAILEQF